MLLQRCDSKAYFSTLCVGKGNNSCYNIVTRVPPFNQCGQPPLVIRELLYFPDTGFFKTALLKLSTVVCGRASIFLRNRLILFSNFVFCLERVGYEMASLPLHCSKRYLKLKQILFCDFSLPVVLRDASRF